MSTWSGIRNKLESDYLCPALRGHIQYFATSYSKSADHEGRAAIRVDGVEVLRSNYYTYFENVWTKFHHLRSTTLKDHDSAKEAINQAHAYALEQGTFDQKVFYEAFGIFDNQSIEKSLTSENPLVRIFALLDRRLGKRRLLALEESMEQELDWVRAFYVIRMQAEGLIDIVLEQMKKEALYQAISALSAADQALVQGLFFEGQSELDYAGELGISQPAVHKRKVRILKQLKKLLEN